MKNGVITQVFKGGPDEVNNGLFLTYGFHKQDQPCPVTRLVMRNVPLKLMSACRKILARVSRSSPLRKDIGCLVALTAQVPP